MTCVQYDAMYVEYPMYLYDPNNVLKQSALHFAIQEIDEDERLFELLPKARDFVHSTDIYHLAPLHYAIQYDRPNLTQWLLRHGANVRQKDIYGDNAIQIACKYYSQNLHHNVIVQILCFYERIQRIKFKIRFIGSLMCAYRLSVQNVWKPYGVGYYIALNDFNNLKSNGR
jgi:hypothetical protein